MTAPSPAGEDGVDGELVGPSDLAAPMGLLGQPSHPEAVRAVRRVFAAVHAAEKPLA